MSDGLELLRRLKAAELSTEKQILATRVLKKEILNEMDQLLPTVRASLEESRNLFPWKAIDFVKTMKIRPPNQIKFLLEAICVLKGIRPIESIDRFKATVTIDYWEPAKKILTSKTFIRDLQEFEKGNINRENLNEFRARFVGNPEFDRRKLQRAFPPCVQFYDWLFSIERFSVYAQLMRDKKARYESLERARKNSEIDLIEIKRNLKYLIDELQRAAKENKEIKFDVEEEMYGDDSDDSDNESVTSSSSEEYIIPESVIEKARKLKAYMF